MKNIKFIIAICIAGLFAITLNSCKKCRGEDPRAKIINNAAQTVSVQIKTSGGNTVNINNVDPGTFSSYSSYAAGLVTFTLKLDGTNYVKSVAITNCFDYDILIDANNNITSTSIDRNEL